MSSQNSNRKKKNKKKRFIKYFSISFILLFAIAAVTYGFVFISQYTEPENNVEVGDSDFDNTNVNKNKNSLMDTLFGTKQVKINVAVMGTDKEGTRTDVMFVMGYDSKLKRISLLSVPRDTKVNVIDELKQDAKENKRWMPTVCKINEVHSWAYYSGTPKRNEFTVKQLEDLLAVKIDYYVLVDLTAFRKIVDIVGGVDVDVPRDMDYDDPTQDLHIHLKAGMQHLDGEKAEGLVRWRKNNSGTLGYPEGDVGRIVTQQLFLKALMEKVLSTKTLITKAPELIRMIYDYVETDIGIDDAIKYLKFINDVDLNNIVMEKLPGEGRTVMNDNGEKISYFFPDTVEMKAVVDKLFYDIVEEESTAVANGNVLSSKGKKIEILNGGFVNGIAGRTQDKLEEDGFEVSSIGTYEGEKQSQTLIIVNESGLGEDLKKYFVDSKIKVSKSELSDGTDIKIIIGTKEK